MAAPAPEQAVPAQQRDAIARLCERTLADSWSAGTCDGIDYAYTQPSTTRYPFQAYWDSCLTAIAWRRFDPQRSRREIETLLASADADGFVGHAIFWEGPIGFPRRLFYNFTNPRQRMTQTIQAPLLAWAWRIAVGDPREEPAVVHHHDWFGAHRDLDGDGLLWLIQPDESGLDASPQFDPIWHWRAQGLPGFVPLVRRNRRLDFSLERVVAAGGPVACEVMTNVLYGLSQLALDRPSITPALIDRLYDERTGLFVTEGRPAPREPLPLTWAALSPLALPDLPEAIGRRLVEEYLLDNSRFWLPVLPPAVAADEPSFTLRETHLGLRRYWRGPSWMVSAWLLWMGLLRLGYTDEAGELARRFADAVEREGLREYYDPFTGRGMGAQGFGMSALIVELVDPDPAAAASHLGELAV